MKKPSHPSTSGLTRLTPQKNASLDENRIVAPSGIATLPPIDNRRDTYINRPLSVSEFRKHPPINNTIKSTMERPLLSTRLFSLFIANENTTNRPASASGSPRFYQSKMEIHSKCIGLRHHYLGIRYSHLYQVVREILLKTKTCQLNDPVEKNII